jgi:hypothetical protein
MSVRQLQTPLNCRLKANHDGNAVRDPRRLAGWSDLSSPVRGEVPEGATRPWPSIQAEFYLTPETYRRLGQKAAHRGITQSSLVEEALQAALGR